MSISLNKSLTVPKVSQDYANNAWSERFQNPSLSIYPHWNGQDSMGRPSNHNAHVTLTAGASHPLNRINVENSVTRPNYAVYLNASGIQGDDQVTNPSYGGYDTAGVRRDEAFGMTGSFKVPAAPVSSSFAVRSENERARINAALQRKYQALRYANIHHP